MRIPLSPIAVERIRQQVSRTHDEVTFALDFAVDGEALEQLIQVAFSDGSVTASPPAPLTFARLNEVYGQWFPRPWRALGVERPEEESSQPDVLVTWHARVDNCWRCDAVPAETDVGLCEDCRDDLAQPPPGEHR